MTESLKERDMDKATEHKRFLEERQRKEERHRAETPAAWRTKYFERKVRTHLRRVFKIMIIYIYYKGKVTGDILDVLLL